MPLFQSDEFYAFLGRTGILEPFRYTVSRSGEEVGRMQGFIQQDGGAVKRFFSRRAIINGGPWLAEDITDEELDSLLVQCIEGLKRKAIYIEIRNFRDYSRYMSSFEQAGFIYEPHYDYIIDTSDGVWKQKMESSRMRYVKSSIRQGASIVESPTEEQVRAFYALLKTLYAERVKTPLFPWLLFRKIYEEPFCRYSLVQYQEKIMGGMLCVFDESTAYEWFVCGLDGVSKHVHPSTLATYSAICFAEDNGCKRFDMMGAGAPGDGGYGVREFKMKFGGELVEFGRFRHICNPLLYRIGKTAVGLMKKR